MSRFSTIGGVFALAVACGCACGVSAKDPAFKSMQWEYEAFDCGVWTIDSDGVMTASKDRAIWSAAEYENFILDFDYKLEPGANSGVILYAINPANWIPGSVEVQLLDDNHARWSKCPAREKNSSLYGHLAPLATPAKPAGEWNHMTITAKGQRIQVTLNGVKTVDTDLSAWTNPRKNPDGTSIPPWVSTPWATIPTIGHIGFQGLHGGARPYFRNVRIAPIPDLKPYTDGATARTAAYRRERALAEKLAREPVLAIDAGSVSSTASGYAGHEAPAQALQSQAGSKLCCNWKGALTLSAALTDSAKVTHYTLASANDYPDRDPKCWELYASTDGQTWQLVDTRTDVKYTSRNQLKSFDLKQPVTARQFKLVVKSNRGAPMIQFSRLTFRR